MAEGQRFARWTPPRRFLSLWGGLPDFCALVPMVWCASYAVTLLMLGSRAGAQGSTAGIAIGLALAAAPLLGAIGSLVGRIALRVLVPFVPARATTVMRWGVAGALIVVAILASHHASAPIRVAEAQAQPRVIQRSTSFRRLDVVPPTEGITRATRIFDNLARLNRPLAWNGGSLQLEIADDALVKFDDASNVLRIPHRGIRYVASVDAMTFQDAAGSRTSLALLITGSATGRRDLLAIVSASRELVYLELLERTWSLGPVPLAILQSPARDVVLVGSEPQGMVAYGS